MLYKDKKEILNFLGEWTTYAYIFSAFFNSKLNMKIGYLNIWNVFIDFSFGLYLELYFSWYDWDE